MGIIIMLLAVLFKESSLLSSGCNVVTISSEQLLICTLSEVYLTDEDKQLNIKNLDIDKFYEIKFENSTLHELPSTVFTEVPKLRTLKASKSDIKDIVPNTFTSARNLRKLFLSENNIIELKNDTFKGAYDLGIIDVSKNIIEHVESMTFAELKYLSFVNLSHNQVEFIDANTFNFNHLLLNLDLSYNNLKNLELQLSSIASLDASYNMIEKFSVNQLDSKLNDPYYSKFFIKLHLDHNQINQFKVDKKYKVRYLGLDHNQITDLTELRGRLPSYLEVVDLSNNNLGLLTQETFKEFYNVKNLYINNASIQLENENVFATLVNLTELDISYNQLESIPTNAFSNLVSIELLKLDGNNLTHLNVQHLPEKIFALSILHNNWKCDYLEQLFEEMREHNKVHVPPTSDLEATLEPNINGVTCFE